MSNFSFSWYDKRDLEFQVECSVSKPRKATLEEPEEFAELELISVQPVVGNQLGADILVFMDERYIAEIEIDAESYMDDMGNAE